MAELTIDATLENLDQVLDFVNQQMELAGCTPKLMNQVDVAVEEIYVNIARYAYHPDVGKAQVRCETGGDPFRIVIGFVDRGRPYNPLEKEDPDVTLSAEKREIGGLGIFLAKQLMDEIEYEFREGENILTLRKIVK